MRRTLLFLVTSVSLFATVAWAEPVGTIETVDPPSSTVSVRSGQGALRDAAVGSEVDQADHLLPKAGETVTLLLKDGSEVTATAGSDVAVSDYVPSLSASVPHVELSEGTAHFNVTKSATGKTTFYIKTRSATIGVRGTEFIVDQRSNGYSTVHTLEGTVWMGRTEADLDNPSKSVAVPSGKTSYLHPSMSAPSSPRIFNRKTYLTQLGKQYPGMMKQVRRVQLRRDRDEMNRPESERRKERLKDQQEQDQTRRRRRPRPRHK